MKAKQKIIVDYKKHKIKSSQYEFNDVKSKTEWRRFVADFEGKASVKRTPLDLSQTLPEKLISKCKEILRDPVLLAHRREPESTGEIEQKPSYKFTDEKKFVLNIDDVPPARDFYKTNDNWVELFAGTRKQERVKWPSKIHKSVFAFDEKNLFEQTEELIDQTAEEFIEWLNTLGKEKSFVTKELVKKDFSIGIDQEQMQALHLDPQMKYAVPRDIAEFFHLPNMSVQNRIKAVLKNDENLKKVKPKKNVAFGKTLPVYLRQPKIETDKDEISPDFPKTIRTCENIFKNICHLRSTKLLIQHMIDNEEIPRPVYLIEEKMFETVPEKVSYVPLYEIFDS